MNSNGKFGASCEEVAPVEHTAITKARHAAGVFHGNRRHDVIARLERHLQVIPQANPRAVADNSNDIIPGSKVAAVTEAQEQQSFGAELGTAPTTAGVV